MLARHQTLRITQSQGFTLVEVLLVVTLFALMAAFLVPNLSVSEQSKTDTFATHVEILFGEMSEYSVYSGELLALRITDTQLIPLRFASYEDGFQPYSADTGSIKPLALPAQLSVRWEDEDIDASQQADPDALTRWQESDDTITSSKEFGRKEVVPEVFFYPSGEASAGTLILYSDDVNTSVSHKITLNPLGRPSLERDNEA